MTRPVGKTTRKKRITFFVAICSVLALAKLLPIKQFEANYTRIHPIFWTKFARISKKHSLAGRSAFSVSNILLYFGNVVNFYCMIWFFLCCLNITLHILSANSVFKLSLFVSFSLYFTFSFTSTWFFFVCELLRFASFGSYVFLSFLSCFCLVCERIFVSFLRHVYLLSSFETNRAYFRKCAKWYFFLFVCFVWNRFKHIVR